MVKFLINRPIAVIVTVIVLLVFGCATFTKVAVSLLPNIDVPEITVNVVYPNASAEEIETSVAKVLRENFNSLNNLTDIACTSGNNNALIHLSFDFGTRMDLALIEVNEKIDRLVTLLPKGLPRPKVTLASTSSIPLIKIQVQPKRQGDYLNTSELTEKVLKKRLEQIEGVSIVDINGLENAVYTIAPRYDKLAAVGITTENFDSAIRSANLDLGSLSVKDGIYRFYIRMSYRLNDIHQLDKIPIKLDNGSIVTLGGFCDIKYEVAESNTLHLYDGQKGLIITVQKQNRARVNKLIKDVQETVALFRKDYPLINFYLSQDQSFLLQAGVSNLVQDLVIGGFLCVLLLFIFLGNYTSPIIMSISIPLSLIITFIFFYLFNLSFNIISLSGLALGIGMLIDNSIVVIDNITRKRREGLSIEESCVAGTNEVIVPVVSQVLTTVAVYAPLIYLSGIAGALVYDQAIALTISLAVSLLVAFCLNPVLYKLFMNYDIHDIKDDSRIYSWTSRHYHAMISYIFPRKKAFIIITILLMPIGFGLIYLVPVKTLPHIEETESLVKIDWNEPLSIKENTDRVKGLIAGNKQNIAEWESDIGIKQYILQQENTSVQNAEIYYRAADEATKNKVEKSIGSFLRNRYPNATWNVSSAPNAFTELFEDKKPYYEVRFRQLTTKANSDTLNSLLSKIKNRHWTKSSNLLLTTDVEFKLNIDKMALYGVSQENLINTLKRLFGVYTISEIERFDSSTIIRLKNDDVPLYEKLRYPIRGNTGAMYPLSVFISTSYGNDHKYITADKTGVYQSIFFRDDKGLNVSNISNEIDKLASKYGYAASHTGKYFTGKKMFKEIMIIFGISILLLYFILAVQFENLVHPLIVMLTIPLGITGAMLVLWLCGGTMDVMAAIGFVVVLGIVVDDPILKVETINRLRKQHGKDSNNKLVLEELIHQAGEVCLKPLLLTSLTTSLALLPVLFTGGIGNDLQKPMVYVICGGLTIGTFFTLWFIPLAYWFTTKKK